MQHWEIIIFFLIIAIINGSVGFGGGTSYMAILTLYALPHEEMKLTALLCNIIVVTGGVLIFIKNKQMNWRKTIPFVVLSIPAAFLGARLRIGQDIFNITLGLCLVSAALLMWIKTLQLPEDQVRHYRYSVATSTAIGGGIGFLSGMVGIGGGVFLSPVLNLMKWDTARKMAATASFFILVNSVAGIAGQLTLLPATINIPRIVILAVTVFVGGQLGARMGAMKLDQLKIRRITALVVFIAGASVLLKHTSLFK
jgi:hypothetical protein